ncbi:MAG: hypothetical protein LBS69_08795 [Prevotellaceae bacterium]|jgi:hypothetical protein|nr:hypothetical protein [Prevotellaceae bacterium]
MNKNRYSNHREIKAETILSLENLSDFAIQTYENSGTFYRNYSPDLVDYHNNMLTLSRDGIYKLLPEGLFFSEEELKNNTTFKETFEQIKDEKKRISLFFQPFDTEYFKLSLALEKQINKLSEKSNEILLKLFFDKTIEGYATSLRSLFPHISQIKGNEYLIINILKIILDVSKIELIKKECHRKCFIIHIPNFYREEYTQKTQQISTLFDTLKEYFLPFDIDYDFKIKDQQQKFILGENLILDYNTNI